MSEHLRKGDGAVGGVQRSMVVARRAAGCWSCFVVVFRVLKLLKAPSFLERPAKQKVTQIHMKHSCFCLCTFFSISVFLSACLSLSLSTLFSLSLSVCFSPLSVSHCLFVCLSLDHVLFFFSFLWWPK